MGPFWSRAEPWDRLRSLLEEADAARAVGTSLLKFLINFAKGDWVSPGKSQCLMCLFTFNLFLPEMDFAKGLQKMANSCKQTISQEVSPQVPEAPSARLDWEPAGLESTFHVPQLGRAWGQLSRALPGEIQDGAFTSSHQPYLASGSSSPKDTSPWAHTGC